MADLIDNSFPQRATLSRLRARSSRNRRSSWSKPTSSCTWVVRRSPRPRPTFRRPSSPTTRGSSSGITAPSVRRPPWLRATGEGRRGGDRQW
ncbi:MAG: hypothetical protein R2862_02760 [Thermoanaerobaculia bacterium]